MPVVVSDKTAVPVAVPDTKVVQLPVRVPAEDSNLSEASYSDMQAPEPDMVAVPVVAKNQ